MQQILSRVGATATGTASPSQAPHPPSLHGASEPAAPTGPPSSASSSSSSSSSAPPPASQTHPTPQPHEASSTDPIAAAQAAYAAAYAAGMQAAQAEMQRRLAAEASAAGYRGGEEYNGSPSSAPPSSHFPPPPSVTAFATRGRAPSPRSSFRGGEQESVFSLLVGGGGGGGGSAPRSRSPRGSISDPTSYGLTASPTRYGSPDFTPTLAGSANKPGGVYDRLSTPDYFTGVYRRAWMSGDGRINHYSEAATSPDKRFAGSTNTNSNATFSSIAEFLRPNLRTGRNMVPHKK